MWSKCSIQLQCFNLDITVNILLNLLTKSCTVHTLVKLKNSISVESSEILPLIILIISTESFYFSSLNTSTNPFTSKGKNFVLFCFCMSKNPQRFLRNGELIKQREECVPKAFCVTQRHPITLYFSPTQPSTFFVLSLGQIPVVFSPWNI